MQGETRKKKKKALGNEIKKYEARSDQPQHLRKAKVLFVLRGVWRKDQGFNLKVERNRKYSVGAGP